MDHNTCAVLIRILESRLNPYPILWKNRDTDAQLWLRGYLGFMLGVSVITLLELYDWALLKVGSKLLVTSGR